MKRTAAQTLCAASLVLAALSSAGCNERDSTLVEKDRVEVADGGDPTPELQKTAAEYLQAVGMAKDGPQEKAAVVRLVDWLKSKDRASVLLDSQRTKQEVKDFAASAEPVSTTLHLPGFPPAYVTMEHTFRDNRNIKLLMPILSYKESEAAGETPQP